MQDRKMIVGEAYPEIAAELLKPLLSLMRAWLDTGGGDLLKILVLLAITVRTTMHRDFARLTQKELLSGEIAVFPALRTNARSVADTIGAPKETVRRKVADLIETGWLVREAGRLRLTALAYQQLTPIREQFLILAVRCYEVISDLEERR